MYVNCSYKRNGRVSSNAPEQGTSVQIIHLEDIARLASNAGVGSLSILQHCVLFKKHSRSASVLRLMCGDHFHLLKHEHLYVPV